MEPLKTYFPRLTTRETEIVVSFLQRGQNTISCVICNKEVFSGGRCLECPFKDKPIRDLLIESHIPLVLDIAGKIGGRKRTEVISVGLLVLIEITHNIPEDIKDIGSFIRVWVTNEIKTFLVTKTIIQVPWYGLKTHGHLRKVSTLGDRAAVSGEQDLVDLHELLARIPTNKNEETIMKCIVEGGYSLQEMSDMCSVKRARVSQIKHSLLDRIQESVRKESV